MKTGGGGLQVKGRGGQALSEKWATGPRSLFGMLCNGFPNMLILTGPQSPSVLTNIPTAIEMQVEWIQQCLDVTEGTVWDAQNPVLGGCSTWYTTFGVGKDAVTVPLAYTGGARAYQKILKQDKATLGLNFRTQ